MGFASAEEARKHRNLYIIIVTALAVFTGITVAAAQLHLPTAWAITVAMLVACVKGTLVACVFMHLITETRTLLAILALCVVFFFALLLGPVFTSIESVFLK